MTVQRWNLLIAAVVYVVAAWFGVGYHGEDEFQHVILVAEHLRGHVGTESMPLDYHAQWRSMLLPMLAAGLFDVCEVLGIQDPFQLTFLLRLITAALALWTMQGLVRVITPALRPQNRTALTALSWFLWFVPVLQIRFSGEAWSGLLFARGLTLLLDEKPRSPWAIGAWWGMAVVCRPAAAILPLSACVWAWVMKKTDARHLLRIVVGAMTALAAGVLIDRLAYGTFTLTLWNYFTAALSGEEAARFTALPLHQYLLFAFKYATVPVAALLLMALGSLFLLDRRHPLPWLILPFLIAHSILPIKEPRFLFPLAPLMPWLLMAAWDALCARWPKTMSRTLWMRILFPFAALNALALLVALLTPAGNGRIHLAHAINDRFGTTPVHIDQLGDWRQWIPPFYLAQGSTEVFTEKVVAAKDKPIHLIVGKESLGLNRVTNLKRIASATPPWTHRFLRWYGLEDGYDPLVLYQIESGAIGH